MHSKLHVDLTFLRRRWFFWELAETVEGVFSWESTQYEVTLKITYRSGSDIIFTYHIGINCILFSKAHQCLENHPLGTQVVSKVRFAKTKSKIMFWNPFNLYGSCSKLLGNSLQKEQTQLLLNLRGTVSKTILPESQYF